MPVPSLSARARCGWRTGAGRPSSGSSAEPGSSRGVAAGRYDPAVTSPAPETVLQRLNDAQREAAIATRGPVAILAGAGTGKTTTITHRIAYQVASGAFEAREILAVTFTEKAAGELRGRLRTLG